MKYEYLDRMRITLHKDHELQLRANTLSEISEYADFEIYSKDKMTNEEGCLSFPEIFGYVTRPKKIHIKYQDLDGKKYKEKLASFDSIVVQHEFDHLNGVLFVDRAEKISRGQEFLDEMKAKLN